MVTVRVGRSVRYIHYDRYVPHVVHHWMIPLSSEADTKRPALMNCAPEVGVGTGTTTWSSGAICSDSTSRSRYVASHVAAVDMVVPDFADALLARFDEDQCLCPVSYEAHGFDRYRLGKTGKESSS